MEHQEFNIPDDAQHELVTDCNHSARSVVQDSQSSTFVENNSGDQNRVTRSTTRRQQASALQSKAPLPEGGLGIHPGLNATAALPAQPGTPGETQVLLFNSGTVASTSQMVSSQHVSPRDLPIQASIISLNDGDGKSSNNTARLMLRFSGLASLDFIRDKSGVVTDFTMEPALPLDSATVSDTGLIYNQVQSDSQSSFLRSPPTSSAAAPSSASNSDVSRPSAKRRGSEKSTGNDDNYSPTLSYSKSEYTGIDEALKRPTKKQKIVKLPIAIENSRGGRNIYEFYEINNISVANKPATAQKSKTTNRSTSAKGELVPKTQQNVKKEKTMATQYYTNAQGSKPEPYGQPEVWSRGREALCSALPYYKSYQGSAYTGNKLVKGCLIDKESGLRDVFNHEIIITDIGGGKSVGADGTRERQEDQKKSNVVQSWIGSMKAREPVGVIAGQGNRLSPSRLPHVYNVLDWFQVTDVWSEKVNGIQTWKIRLEKLDLSKISWWIPKGSNMIQSSDESPKAAEACCRTCRQLSKATFKQGWSCLKPDCQSYWKFVYPVSEAELEYSSEFLQERTLFQGPLPGLLKPVFEPGDECEDQDSSGKYCKGIVCPRCGCCSRRKEWLRWKCENVTHCSFSFSIPLRVMSINDVVSEGKRKEAMMLVACMKTRDPAIKMMQHRFGRYYTDVYQVIGPSGDRIGAIAHFKADEFINVQPDGPDSIYWQLQHTELGLKRSAARQADHPGEVMTNHFGANWGAPYKYGVRQLSKPFSETPLLLLRVVQRLMWAGKMAVGIDHQNQAFNDFNELLTLAYLKGQSISYHDDGEKELGPTVASLSLGAYATMSWRPKKGSGIGTSKNAAGTKPPMLKILLKHGDMMVMHGDQIQKYYEHEVTPQGPLRFGLTCRYIRPEMLPTAEERQYAITAGTLPEGPARVPYNGDCPKEFLQDFMHQSVPAGVITQREAELAIQV